MRDERPVMTFDESTCVMWKHWERERECEREWRRASHTETPTAAALAQTPTHTFALSHINTLNWGSGYTVIYLAALWAKGCDEPWKNLPPPPTRAHCDSRRQTHKEAGWKTTAKTYCGSIRGLGNTFFISVISYCQFEYKKKKSWVFTLRSKIWCIIPKGNK